MEVQKDLPWTRLIRCAGVHVVVDWRDFHAMIPFFAVLLSGCKTAGPCSFSTKYLPVKEAPILCSHFQIVIK